MTRMILAMTAAALLPGSALGQPLANPDPLPAIDGADREAIVDSVARSIRDVYVFPDVGEKMAKLIEKNVRGRKYDGAARPGDFADMLTQDLQSVSKDLHLSVRAGGPYVAPANDDEEQAEYEAQMARMARDNYGWKKIERMEGNIGYVKLDGFVDAAHAGATAIAAMNFLANVDALIFDLRTNGGGSPSMIQLITSYLFDERTHLNSFYVRSSDSMEQYWTQAFVEGPRITDVPVYVLTSNFTFSAAEEFSYNLKNLERGVIVGETTGGGAHPVEMHTFSFDGYSISMSLPFGRAVNPVTGTNWEGTGVEPDIAVPASEALDAAVEDALVNLMDGADNDRKHALQWSLDGYRARRNPVVLSESAALAYAGKYGPRNVRLEGGALYYQRTGRPEIRMIPLGDDRFSLEGLDFFRIEFVRDDTGRVVEFVGRYQDGRSDSNPRTDS
ncbi:MAG: S41 family peptidase [Gemmatimonadetes bacterium]|nr:S41 family peptidase [Gemmatimonadota bacterium]